MGCNLFESGLTFHIFVRYTGKLGYKWGNRNFGVNDFITPNFLSIRTYLNI